MHGIYLETGSSRALATACENTVVSTTDLGVELSLPQVQPSPFSNNLPHYDHAERPPAHVVDDGFEKVASADIDDDISLCNTLGIPGMLHIIHNVATSLLSILVVLKWAIELLTEVSNLCVCQHHVTGCVKHASVAAGVNCISQLSMALTVKSMKEGGIHCLLRTTYS